jgi:hypothetical protein
VIFKGFKVYKAFLKEQMMDNTGSVLQPKSAWV